MNGISKLLLGLHCHQPVDNFASVVDKAIKLSYRPFFEVVSRFPSFKFSIHFSGWLFDYIRMHDNGLFELIKKCHDNKQVEFFTGGFYEPILASIPSRDRKGQIGKLNDFLHLHFGAKPKGLWLTERVWDASIIDDIVSVGVEYVIVDDYHFISAGFDKRGLGGYFLSENGGNIIKIFPINKDLRYILPFKKPNVVIESIKKNGEVGVLFDDGEKFGLWPKTYEWVYEKKWLEEFLEAFTSDETLTTEHYSEFAAINKPLGMAYLPNVSYYEMGEWSLRANDTIALEHLHSNVVLGYGFETADKFVKGGIWKNFLVKYAESNRIHKRALELAKFADEVDFAEFTESLYKAQTNDALWHGVFGGLYLGCLRDNAYKFIIECENIYKNKNPDKKLIVADINLDGYDEVRFLLSGLTLMFESKSGGQLSEFCLRDRLFNLQNTLTRRYEAYHDKIFNPPAPAPVKEDEIETIHNMDLTKFEHLRDEIAYDWYDKNSFIDHITNDEFCLENFRKCTFKEFGDFANQPFDIDSVCEKEAVFVRKGAIYDDAIDETIVKKSFTVSDNGIGFNILIDTQSKKEYRYVCEMNLHLPDIARVTVNGDSLRNNGCIQNSKIITVEDKVLDKVFVFSFDSAVDTYIYTVDTVSQNEEGFELSNQALCFGFSLPLKQKMTLSGRFDVSL